MVFEKLRRRDKSERMTSQSQQRTSAKLAAARRSDRELLKNNDLARRNTAAMTVLSDDVEDVFYNRNAGAGGAPMIDRSTSHTDAFQYRVTAGNQSPPSSQTSSVTLDACDARTLRSELADVKEEVEAIRREMLNELNSTRYDMLKEMAMIKGALLQLTNMLQHSAVAAAAPSATSSTTSSTSLQPEDVEAISRRLTTQSSRAHKERLTTPRDDHVPPAARMSTRPTQLAPVADAALSTPLRQQQLDEMFPLIDCAADVSVQARILEPGTRDWVVDRVQQWLDSRFDVGKDTLLAMVGDAGTGKSVAASAVCVKFAEHVVAIHLCKFDRKAKSSPRNVLLSLVHQLINALPGFKSQLARLNLRYVLEEKDVVALARRVLVDPLKALEEPVSSVFMIVDGIDQCRTRAGNELLSFLSIVQPELPTWLGVLLTSKPSPELAANLTITSLLDLSPRNPRYMEDAALLINEVLSGFQERDLAEAKQVLKAKSAGNFSYLEFAKHALGHSSMENSRGIVPVDVLHDLPESLYEIYDEIFEDKFGQGRARLWRKVQPVLNLVVSAAASLHAPITERQIADWLSYSKDDLLLVRRSFSDLISVRQGAYFIMSSALFDWLADPARQNEEFSVDIELGLQTLRKAARGELVAPATSISSNSTSIASHVSARRPPMNPAHSPTSSASSSSSSVEEDFGAHEPRQPSTRQPVGILKRRGMP